jgi:uncharacterized spore protein YtfJ
MESMREVHEFQARSGELVDQAINRIFAAAQPGAVFSPPVQSGQYTVITASQIASGGGFGSGLGFGQSQRKSPEAEPAAPQPGNVGGGGGGLGGGGGASARPVAAIVIGPAGVEVKPILDVSRLGLSVLSTVLGILALQARLRRATRK